MKIFTYSEARQNFSKLLSMAQNEEVQIRRKDGSIFILKIKNDNTGSPFDIPGVKTKAKTTDVLNAIKESRQR